MTAPQCHTVEAGSSSCEFTDVMPLHFMFTLYTHVAMVVHI